jgi:hypothetical protein
MLQSPGYGGIENLQIFLVGSPGNRVAIGLGLIPAFKNNLI